MGHPSFNIFRMQSFSVVQLTILGVGYWMIVLWLPSSRSVEEMEPIFTRDVPSENGIGPRILYECEVERRPAFLGKDLGRKRGNRLF